jgi:hypothetical protein
MSKRTILVSLLAVLVVMAVPPSLALAWAPVGQATIHPGVQVFTEGAQCTSNFVFQDASNVYLGQAAHCSGTGGQTETNGCTSGSLPLGTPVGVTGASKPGTLVYNSWLTMQARGENDPDTCAYNDLALIRLDPADVAKVNPSIPGFGGPTGVGSAGGTGSTVYSYGNSELRGGVTKLSPKQGVLVQNEGNGWSHVVVTLTPGIPGDSGSGFLNASGGAIGILSTLQLAPLPATNGVGDLAKELAYMRAKQPLRRSAPRARHTAVQAQPGRSDARRLGGIGGTRVGRLASAGPSGTRTQRGRIAALFGRPRTP